MASATAPEQVDRAALDLASPAGPSRLPLRGVSSSKRDGKQLVGKRSVEKKENVVVVIVSADDH